MVTVDTSALLAILLDEPEKAVFERTLAGEARNVMSALNAFEAAIVLRGRYGAGALKRLWRLIAINSIEIVAFDEAQMHLAAAAFDRFGKGIHSQARLNLCDCAAYALAKAMNVPLLFKRNDFSHTDIASAA